MADTPYTKGFKAGMAWKEEELRKRSFLDEAIHQARIKERENMVDFETRLDLVQIELDEIGKIIKELEESLNELADKYKLGK